MSDDGLDTLVAGVRCREVLADLSEYVDGALTPERIGVLQAHLADCDRCARFGADVVRGLTALREGLREPTALPSDISARLHARVRAVTQG